MKVSKQQTGHCNTKSGFVSQTEDLQN